MLKRIMFGGLLIVAASCGDDAKDTANSGDGGTAGSGAASGDGGSSGSNASGGSSGSNSSSSSSSSGSGGSSSSSGGSSSTDTGGSDSSPGAAPTDGSQLARCQRNSDCADGLNCYVFGGYCSSACATDADCSSLGSGYTCNARMTTGGGGPGGGFPGGGGPTGGDAAAPEPTGTCRLQCTEGGTECPAGLTCMTVGGGGMFGGGPGGGSDGGTAMATGRCAYEPEEPTPGGDAGMDNNQSAGTTPAFGQCMNDDECADGLQCTANRGSSGYCAESCMQGSECTMQPSSGTATATCGFGGSCSLSCAEMGSTCPDGMMCVRAGGGGMQGGGAAFCNFMSTNGGFQPGGG